MRNGRRNQEDERLREVLDDGHVRFECIANTFQQLHVSRKRQSDLNMKHNSLQLVV